MATRTVAAGGGNSNAAGTFVEAAALANGDDLVMNATSGSLNVTTNYSLNSVAINGGTGTAKPVIASSAFGTARTLTSASISVDNINIRDIIWGSAGNIDLSAALVGNLGGNGITGGGALTWPSSTTQTFSGTKNYSDVTAWTSRVPLAGIDDAVFSGTGTCTVDMAHLFRSCSFSGACNLTLGNVVTTYGSLDFTGAGTLAGSQVWIAAGRGNYLLTSAGKSFRGGFYLRAPGGTLTTQDAFSNPYAYFQVDKGTWHSDYSAATLYFTGSGIVEGSGAWTFQSTVTNLSGVTWNATGSMTFSYAGASNATHNLGTSKTYPNAINIIGGGAGVCYLQATTAVTFTGLVTVGNSKFLKWTSGATYNFAQKPVLVGASGAVISMVVTTPGTPATLNYSGAGKIQTNYLDVTDTNVTPADTWYAADSTINSGTGWVAGVIPAGNLGAFEQGAFAVGAYETGAWR